MDGQDALSLRARKQRRTREAILAAAIDLFTRHGFDHVTVSQIARHAEVGRTTFFRYFTDKQELLFADDALYLEVLTGAIHAAAPAVAPIGDSLPRALAVARSAMLAVAESIETREGWLPVRERLVQQHPALTGRALTKEREYQVRAVELLVGYGATAVTATLAVGVAAACYAAAQATIATGPTPLPPAVEAAFRQLADAGLAFSTEPAKTR